MEFSEKKISKLLRGIYKGTINPLNLPNDLYTATAKHLMSGAYEGFGFDLSTAKGKKLVKLLDLRDNIYMFSAAKTHKQVTVMSDLIRNDKGVIKSFSQFKNDVLPVYKEYNVDWLKAEYNTAIGQGQITDQWTNIVENAEQFPLLKYEAVLGGHTCDICAPLDGIVRPVNDPFWRKWMPLNHFNCMCIVVQLSKGDEKITDSRTLEKMTKKPSSLISPVFAHNAGITGQIFPKSHPYFDVDKKDIPFAKTNFGLKIPKKD